MRSKSYTRKCNWEVMEYVALYDWIYMRNLHLKTNGNVAMARVGTNGECLDCNQIQL